MNPIDKTECEYCHTPIKVNTIDERLTCNQCGWSQVNWYYQGHIINEIRNTNHSKTKPDES